MLDAYFKSYFWTFTLGALLIGAYMVAKISNVFVGRALEPPVGQLYRDDRPIRRTVRAEPTNQTNAAAFLERNLFGADREDLTPVDPTAEELAAAERAAQQADIIDEGACTPERCQASAVPANLLATLWYGDPKFSYAVFQATSGGDVEVLGAGESLLDQATITAVYRNNVCVSRSGACEIFSLKEAKKKVNKAAKPSPVVRNQNGDEAVGKGVRKLGDKAYEIEKSEIDNVLSNLNKIARQARIVPSFKNGKSNGFKLFSIRPNSLYSKIGIQNGDIVQKINGFEINSPDKALEIYSKLKDADSITVDLVRRGKPQTMSYSIR